MFNFFPMKNVVGLVNTCKFYSKLHSSPSLSIFSNISDDKTRILKSNKICFQDCRMFSNEASITEELNLPQAPKRPVNYALQYALDVRSKNKDKIQAVDMSTLVKAFKDLPENEIEEYKTDYASHLMAYKESLKEYHDQLSPADKMNIEELALKRLVIQLKNVSEKRTTLEKLARKKKEQIFGKPKHPGNGYMIFVIDYSKKTSEFDLLKCSKAWKSLDDKQKSIYNDIFKQKLIKYKEDLSQWEAKMLSEGNVDLVRKVSQPPEAKPKSKQSKVEAKPKSKVEAKPKSKVEAKPRTSKNQ